MPDKKYYVVWKGHQRGVYKSWAECKVQIDGFKGAYYKSYKDLDIARRALKNGGEIRSKSINSKIIKPSLSVDAACSGNPGVMEYQGVNTETKEQVFHMKFEEGTNNIGEFLGIVHGLAFLKQHKSNLPIYTDSRIAMGWVEKKKCKTKLEPNFKNAKLFEMIKRGEDWLKANSYTNKILKWETKSWGEIPADFGRK